MAFNTRDIKNIFVALEELLGSNTATTDLSAAEVPFQVECVIGYGAGQRNKTYYVIVQQFSGLLSAGNPFLPVQINVSDLSASHVATAITASAASTYGAALSAVTTLVTAANPQTARGFGQILQNA